ncbi:50S ribosomal protein L18 [Selenihalanaerobacter shriftii]|uniref:Large ribosomal subunit protein uL18 n=1 Tax=Selenihalanaerobacter shriftii TaxID=142842 RepID=A0A1T4Q4Z7_9FIRM|nr:50S ribosomal protein L18 [Selenihalanaerobacter shriftii]SJZ98744.1 LSU ribosomal protein L18P [Selenihalanaerobacter shriftii]
MSTSRQRRHKRVRKKVSGTPSKPRLNVYRSLKHIYAQVIDDLAGETLVSASTIEPAIRDEVDNGGNVEAAKEVGKLVAKRALEEGIEQVVFDRGGNKFHGRIKAVAEAARESGLEF